MARQHTTTMLDAVTATGYSEARKPVDYERTFQASGATTAGVGAATIVVQVSSKPTPGIANDADWITAGTITLTLGTAGTSDGFAMAAPWLWCRFKLTAISGTGASVSAYMGA